MRTATWINYRHETDDFKDKWFDGFLTNHDEVINVPLFNMDEIQELCTSINPSIQNFAGIEAAENVNHPFIFNFIINSTRKISR